MLTHHQDLNMVPPAIGSVKQIASVWIYQWRQRALKSSLTILVSGGHRSPRTEKMTSIGSSTPTTSKAGYKRSKPPNNKSLPWGTTPLICLCRQRPKLWPRKNRWQSYPGQTDICEARTSPRAFGRSWGNGAITSAALDPTRDSNVWNRSEKEKVLIADFAVRS